MFGLIGNVVDGIETLPISILCLQVRRRMAKADGAFPSSKGIDTSCKSNQPIIAHFYILTQRWPFRPFYFHS